MENAEPIEMIPSPIVHLFYDRGTRVEENKIAFFFFPLLFLSLSFPSPLLTKCVSN